MLQSYRQVVAAMARSTASQHGWVMASWHMDSTATRECARVLQVTLDVYRRLAVLDQDQRWSSVNVSGVWIHPNRYTINN